MHYVVVIRGEAKSVIPRKGEDDKLFEAAVDRFGGDHVFKVSGTPTSPPPGHRRKGNLLWCPYCGSLRRFRYKKRTRLHHCPICDISEKDFHVRRMNYMDHVDSHRAVSVKLRGRS